MNVVSLWQRNPQWSRVKLLPSDLTIGRYGCTTTAICDLAAWYGCPKNPDQVIGTNIQYTKGGLVIWKDIKFSNFHFVKRFYGMQKDVIDAALAAPFDTVLLEVGHSHWIWAIGHAWGGGYRICDPWDGSKSTTIRYKNDITGGAVFTATLKP
jgi:hypothetical protein